MTIKKFEDLIIWEEAVSITKEAFLIVENDKFRKDYSFRDQIRRALVSISSNIVEGYERNNNIEFIRYLKIAKGSLGEARSQLLVAFEVNYITREQLDSVNLKLKELANKIGKLILYLRQNKLANPRTRN